MLFFYNLLNINKLCFVQRTGLEPVTSTVSSWARFCSSQRFIITQEMLSQCITLYKGGDLAYSSNAATESLFIDEKGR